MDNVEKKLQGCLDTLIEIKQSGYWPFVSPAPCSTEQRIKSAIEFGIMRIQDALYWHQQMFGNTGRPSEKCVSMKIEEK